MQSEDDIGGSCGGPHHHHAVVANDEKELIEIVRGQEIEVANVVEVAHNRGCNDAEDDGDDAVANDADDDDDDAVVNDDDEGACTTKDTTPGDATDDEAIDTQM